VADADLPRCLSFPPATASHSPMTGPSAYAVDRSRRAARSGAWTRPHPPTGTGPVFPNRAIGSIRHRAPSGPATPAPRSSAPSGSDTDRRGSSSPPTTERTTSSDSQLVACLRRHERFGEPVASSRMRHWLRRNGSSSGGLRQRSGVSPSPSPRAGDARSCSSRRDPPAGAPRRQARVRVAHSPPRRAQ